MKLLPALLAGITMTAVAQEAGLPDKLETPAPWPPGTAGVVVTVDEAFATKHENKPPPVPFQVTAPKAKDLRVLAGGKKSGAPELLRLTLPTADGKKAAEILRFGPLNLPAGPLETRLKAAAGLLKTTGYNMFTRGFENPEVLEIYRTKIGGNDAVCMHLKMNEPGGSPVWLVKAVAILHPDGADGVTGFLMADNQQSEVKSPAELSSKGTGLQMLHSVRFLPKPKP